MRRASSANHSTNELPYAISPSDSASGLPDSAVMISAMRCLFASSNDSHFFSRAARSLAVSACQPGDLKAALAASMARCASSASMSGTVPTFAPSAGLRTASSRFAALLTHWPLTSVLFGCRCMLRELARDDDGWVRLSTLQRARDTLTARPVAMRLIIVDGTLCICCRFVCVFAQLFNSVSYRAQELTKVHKHKSNLSSVCCACALAKTFKLSGGVEV